MIWTRFHGLVIESTKRHWTSSGFPLDGLRRVAFVLGPPLGDHGPWGSYDRTLKTFSRARGSMAAQQDPWRGHSVAPSGVKDVMPTTTPPTPRPAWKTALVWLERLVTAGLLIFVAIRLGPQVGALVGVARDQGRAPAYALVTMSGDTVQSVDLAGKVVVVNFWATWCIPCRLEMPSLQALHERHRGDDVVVLGFATDVGGEQAIRTFLADRGITYPVGRATQAHRQAFGGIPGIPTTFLVDRQGNVRHKVVGYFAPPALNAAVNRLLAEPSPNLP